MKQPASSIEIAKALRQIRSVVDAPTYEQVFGILAAHQPERIGQAVAGLTEEDEFLLLCLLMGTATHLAPLEQRPAVVAGKSAPDLLARFQPGFWGTGIQRRGSQHAGYRCFVEVKSTKQNEFEMSGAALKRLRDFADCFGIPLVFAVRFLQFDNAALWVLVEDVSRDSKSIRIGIENWIEGLRPVLWNEHSYMVFPGTHFQATFDSSVSGGLLRHSQYGEQVAFEVVTSKGRFPQDGTDALVASAFFEAYGLREVDSRSQGTLTHVLYAPTNAAMSVADLIYAMNRLPRDEEGRLIFDASTALRELADGQRLPLVDRRFVEHFGDRFCDIAAMGIMEYGEPTARYRRWLATGGRPDME